MLKMRKSWKVKRNNKWVFLLILVPVLAITIGYSWLERSFSAGGNITIGELRWDVEIVPESLGIVDTANGNFNDDATVTLSEDGQTITWNGVFGEVGQNICIMFSVRNNGTIGATLRQMSASTMDGISLYSGYKGYYSTSFSYDCPLAKGEQNTIAYCYYFTDESPEALEAMSGQTGTLSFTIRAIQSNAIKSYVQDDLSVSRHTYNAYAIKFINIEITPDKNLFSRLLIRNQSFTNKKAYDENNHMVMYEGIDESIVIPVIPGDHIKANPFEGKDTNGSEGTTDGVFITYLNNNTIVSRKSAEEVYTEFSTNGYLTVPEGVNAVNVPYYTNSTRDFYILNP